MHEPRLRRELSHSVVLTGCGVMLLLAPLWSWADGLRSGLGLLLVVVGTWSSVGGYRDLQRCVAQRQIRAGRDGTLSDRR